MELVMRLNPNLPNAPHPVPDAVPVHTGHPRPQTPSSATAGFFYSVPPPPGTDDVQANWKGNEGVIVTFTDKKSGEVVRQIPSEQVLSVARFIRKVLDEAETSKSRTQS
jgi:hypothetical protein